MLTGRPPFNEETFWGTVLKVRSPEPPPAVRSLRPEVPVLLEQICHKCLNKRPADRYTSVRELAEELRRFRQDDSQPTLAAPVSLTAVPTGEVIPLAKETTVVGRSVKCDLVLEKFDVSRQHCRIIRTPGKVIVEDLGSRGGTRVNGSRVVRTELSDGDYLQIGGQLFKVVLR